MKINKKCTLPFGIMWIINIILLLVLILIPKNNDVFNNLYVVFLIGVFVLPLVLIFLQSYMQMKLDNESNCLPCMSNAACSIIISLTFVRFIATIKNSVVVEMVTIMCVFIALELLIGYFVLITKNFKEKKFILLSAATYISLVLFFFCAMIISYDHSINW